ncbi:MAG: hypothetical protein J3R72DRAFT_432065 [Linnemannia gamsii]|nr:MAG: hypothetical protein J3R72DRAFT_432065 [Linnemannia gamsii]
MNNMSTVLSLPFFPLHSGLPFPCCGVFFVLPYCLPDSCHVFLFVSNLLIVLLIASLQGK